MPRRSAVAKLRVPQDLRRARDIYRDSENIVSFLVSYLLIVRTFLFFTLEKRWFSMKRYPTRSPAIRVVANLNGLCGALVARRRTPREPDHLLTTYSTSLFFKSHFTTYVFSEYIVHLKRAPAPLLWALFVFSRFVYPARRP